MKRKALSYTQEFWSMYSQCNFSMSGKTKVRLSKPPYLSLKASLNPISWLILVYGLQSINQTENWQSSNGYVGRNVLSKVMWGVKVRSLVCC